MKLVTITGERDFCFPPSPTSDEQKKIDGSHFRNTKDQHIFQSHKTLCALSSVFESCLLHVYMFFLQFSGLSKPKSINQAQTAKVQTLGPARVSGLRKKSVGSGKKTTSNNENNPGVQATISSLWKNFSFKK